MKKYTRSEFSTANIAEMMPGQTVVIECQNAREVQNVRLLASQYKRLSNPANIVRYASVCQTNNDGTIDLQLTAVTE